MEKSYWFYVFKLLRPRQWIKNLALFAAIVFGELLFDVPTLFQVSLGFFAFCFLSSITYIINDIFDVKKDRLHPFKKNRPIASGKVAIKEAVFILLILVLGVVVTAASLPPAFWLIALLYLAIQFLYSFFFKAVVIFDIFTIATGYILRVLAGEIITGYHISVWLLLTTIALSLFLAVAKRRSELTLLKSVKSTDIAEIRKSLSHYSEGLLDAFSAMFATATFIFYSMFTFLENPTGVKINLTVLLPDFLPYYLQRKWLMITIFPVIYGLMKYLQDVYEKNEGESPDRVILADKSLLASVVLWAFLVIVIIYFIG